MDTFVIRNLEIDVLLSRLHSSYSNKLEKVWENTDMINAVFIQSELAIRTMSEQSITIIVQYYKETRECEVTVVSSGGRNGLLRIDLGSQTAAESTFSEQLVSLAGRKGWEINRKHISYKGSRCPFCSAFYLYKQNQVQDDGSVVCQNCNKSFMLENGAKVEYYTEKIV
jgi:hypothetical protein